MFDIKILGYSFYHDEYVGNIYPAVEMKAVYEDDFLCMPIKIKKIYDAYDYVYNKLDGTLDDMITNFVDELWKEFHKGIPKVYEISLYISLPVGLNMWIKEHIRNEIEKCLAIKRDADKLCIELCNSKFGIISYDMNHMYPELSEYVDTDIVFADNLTSSTVVLKKREYDNKNFAIGRFLEVEAMIRDYNKEREKAKEKIKEYEMKKIEKVIFNDPATIVFWRDGSKTVVKAQDEPFDKEKGLAMAIAKKVYGNEGNYYNEFKKFIKDEPKLGRYDVKEDNKNE